MSRRPVIAPTEAELEILQILWDRGPSSVREVQEILNRKRPTGYTTVLKFLQIMFEKGHVRRDESERSHRYEASRPREEIQGELVEGFIEKVFGGSAENLVMSALGSAKTKPEDLARIRALIDERKNAKNKKSNG